MSDPPRSAVVTHPRTFVVERLQSTSRGLASVAAPVGKSYLWRIRRSRRMGCSAGPDTVAPLNAPTPIRGLNCEKP